MSDERVRRRIARIAAQLMYERLESEYFTAKRKAAKQLGLAYRYRPHDLPTNREIRDQIHVLASLLEGDRRDDALREMRFDALRLMRRLERFHPALIGSVWTGHIRKGSDIDIHLFSDSVTAVTMTLDELGFAYEVERKRVIKHNEERLFTHVHVTGRFPYELTVYPADKLGYVFKSSITGKAIERATLPELMQYLEREYGPLDAEEAARAPIEPEVDRFEMFRLLLLPLEGVKQDARAHPEGDALYHSLQVFELAKEERPWDEEFLLAALLHDVGKAIEPREHVAAGLEALLGMVSERTAHLIGRHLEAHAYADGTLGQKAARRLAADADLEDLMLLNDLDRAGRQRGVEVGTVDEALDYIRSLADEPYL
ncbi:MAG: tRNA adenylyltransferase [Planctomycetes bacterium]|nr:tRNA adenylyltransferase [Planctomycetota bacterium]